MAKKNVRVAINGFGRIGRLAFRQMFGAEGYEIVAINDLTSPKMLAHLLKYDTAQGNYVAMGHTVSYKDAIYAEDGKTVVTPGSITVDGKEITIYAEPKAVNLPWKALDVDVVLECTGFYCSKAKSQAHIDAGAKKVVISAPAGNDLPTVVYGVNEGILKASDTIISAASCTTNCLAPMAKALNDYAPIKSGIMTTVHAYTGDQMVLDGPHRKGDLRRARAAAQNIVPNTTGAAKAIGLVIPELDKKLIGSAQRVPTCTGSTTILVAVVKGKDITVDSINAYMKSVASDSYGYNEDMIVSQRHHRYELRQPVRFHPDHGGKNRRRHLSGAGSCLVRQRKQLYHPDGKDHQILCRTEITLGTKTPEALLRAFFYCGKFRRTAQRLQNVAVMPLNATPAIQRSGGLNCRAVLANHCMQIVLLYATLTKYCGEQCY